MRHLFDQLINVLYAVSYHINLLRISDIAIEDYIARNLHGGAKYKQPNRLSTHELQIFSQSGADGIIAEIFRRIGTTNKFFAEFGVGNGLENNTAALLIGGWSGMWIEASKRANKKIHSEFSGFISERKLRVLPEFITRENLPSLFERGHVPNEPDLLSIDVDGNDYWFLETVLQHYSPRVVVIEYNAQLGPSLPWVMKYDVSHTRESVVSTTYYGASLKALERLGASKGYSLVGCDFMGLNAFFVRSDLLKNKFCGPYTSENHFEPFRLFLYRRNGHPRKVGPFVVPEIAAQAPNTSLADANFQRVAQDH